MKKAAATILLLASGLIAWLFTVKPEPPFGANPEARFLTALADFQAEAVKSGKYSRNKGITAPYEYEITEYLSPLGPGYQVIFYQTIEVQSATGSYQARQTKSVGYGPEAADRTWNWR